MSLSFKYTDFEELDNLFKSKNVIPSGAIASVDRFIFHFHNEDASIEAYDLLKEFYKDRLSDAEFNQYVTRTGTHLNIKETIEVE
jgi:hypothetical protein